jgi:hypothetical protein
MHGGVLGIPEYKQVLAQSTASPLYIHRAGTITYVAWSRAHFGAVDVAVRVFIATHVSSVVLVHDGTVRWGGLAPPENIDCRESNSTALKSYAQIRTECTPPL